MASATANMTRPAFLSTRTVRVVGTTLVAVQLVAHAARFLAIAFVDVPEGYLVTHPVMLTFAAAVGALGGSLAYLALERWLRRPARVFVPLAAALLLLSFGSVTQLATMFPDASPVALAVSPLLHIAVATTSVATTLRMARRA